MNAQRVVRCGVVRLFLLLVLVVAAPAGAQVLGSLTGKVIDAAGKPVANADVLFEFYVDGRASRQVTGETDKNGEYRRVGLMVAGGQWVVTVRTKDGRAGRSEPMAVPSGGVTIVKDIVLKGPAAPSELKLSAEKARSGEIEKRFSEAKADIEAGAYAAAIAKLEQVAKDVENCAACYLRMADAYQKQKDLPSAEKALLEAIRFDAKNPEPYNTLVAIYNEQNRFDEAGKMLATAKGLVTVPGGRVDPVAAFNQGAILWNQGKAAEAAIEFQRAATANPKNADAQYMLGLALMSTGKMAEAKAPLEEYLKLAPKGSNAEAAKELLAGLK